MWLRASLSRFCWAARAWNWTSSSQLHSRTPRWWRLSVTCQRTQPTSPSTRTTPKSWPSSTSWVQNLAPRHSRRQETDQRRAWRIRAWGDGRLGVQTRASAHDWNGGAEAAILSGLSTPLAFSNVLTQQHNGLGAGSVRCQRPLPKLHMGILKGKLLL